MSREAMKQALEAFDALYMNDYSGYEISKHETHIIDDAVKALRQALETEQEPVAFINVEKQKLEWAKLTSWHTPTIVNLPKIPLYTAPPKREWVGLTLNEAEEFYDKYTDRAELINAIDKFLEEKNT
jgi:hypothetical protein